MTDKKNSGGIKIPGVEIQLPESGTGAFSLAVVFLGLVAVVYIVFVHGRPENIEAIGATIGGIHTSLYSEEGQISAAHRRQFQFMTLKAQGAS